MTTTTAGSASTVAIRRYTALFEERAPINVRTRVPRDRHAWPDPTCLRKRTAMFLGTAVLAGFLAIGTAGMAQQAVLPITPVTISTEVQQPAETSTGTNQALMSQMINELNQRQFRLSLAGTEGSFSIAPQAQGRRLAPNLILQNGVVHSKR